MHVVPGVVVCVCGACFIRIVSCCDPLIAIHPSIPRPVINSPPPPMHSVSAVDLFLHRQNAYTAAQRCHTDDAKPPSAYPCQRPVCLALGTPVITLLFFVRTLVTDNPFVLSRIQCSVVASIMLPSMPSSVLLASPHHRPT